MAPDTRKTTMDSLEEQIRVLTQQMEAMVKRQDDTQAVMTERPPELENHQTNHQPQADSKSTSEIGNNNTFFKFLSSTPKLELECPKFDGTNPRNWIQKCGRYMELLKHPDYQRVDIASLYMVGKADEWMRSYLSIRRGVCWNEFVMDLLGKFGDEGVDVCETNGKLEVASESAMKPDIEENSVSGDNILSSVVVSEVANDVLKVAIEPGKGRNPQLETEKVPTTIAPELFDESFKKEKLIVEAYELSKVQISKESIEPMVHLLNSDILLEVTKFDSSHDWGEDYQEQQGLEWRKDQAMKPGTFVSPPAVDIAKNLDSPSNSASLNISTKSMVPPSIVANGGNVSTVNSPVTSRVSTVYSEVQNRRLDHTLPLPSVIKNSFSVIDGPASSVVGNPDEIVELFPCLFGQPSAVLVPGDGKGRAASHITLECALQTHPNITLIGEVVACKKETLKNVNVTDYITDVVCKQAESGANYAVILIPDGLIGFTPEVPHLIEDTEPVKPEGWLDDGPAEIEVPEALEFTRKFMHKLVRIRVQRDELIFEGIKQFYVNADKEEWKREVDWFTFGAFPRVKLKFNIQKWWLSITRLEDKSDVEGKAMLWYHFIKYY